MKSKRSFFYFSLLTLFTLMPFPILWAGLPIRMLSPQIFLEVDPRLELMAAAQGWTDWSADGSGRALAPTPYATELKEFLEPWQGSSAIALLNQMQNQGFSYDAVPAWAVSTMNDLEFLPPTGGFSSYLEGRARGRERLNHLSREFAALAQQSRFGAFFADHQAYYDRLLDQASQGIDAPALTKWLTNYYGADPGVVFHIVLAPALGPSGGYGATIPKGSERHVYQVVRMAEQAQGPALASLSLHEFGHSWVNAAIGDQIPLQAKPALQTLFEPVRDQMTQQAYGNLGTFLNELVLRATTIRGHLGLGLLPPGGQERALVQEEDRGFYPIREVTRWLEDYEANRTRWPRFSDFGPELMTRLAGRSEALVSERAGRQVRKGLSTFTTGFEEPNAPAPWFGLSIGANTKAPLMSEVVLDSVAPPEGGQYLTLRGNLDTGAWRIVAADLAPRSGTVVARYQVKGTNLRQEADQFNNAYVGFILESKEGKKMFRVRSYRGTFDWKTDDAVAVVDAASVKSLRFALFLSISGELSIDAVTVDWQ